MAGYSMLGFDLPEGCSTAIGCVTFVIVAAIAGSCILGWWGWKSIFGGPSDSTQEQPAPSDQERTGNATQPSFSWSSVDAGSVSIPQRPRTRSRR
jgi:hypothetical protein